VARRLIFGGVLLLSVTEPDPNNLYLQAAPGDTWVVLTKDDLGAER
jgi:hypothetical protein